ncbi:UNVERIFIED_CONTAM: hypothetical protein K2H54_048205 [Gekko kuhli]
MTSTHLETQGLFEEVAAAMRGHGYRRTTAQVCAKFKREKAEFFDALEDWHGIPPRVSTPKILAPKGPMGAGGRPGWRLKAPNHPVVVVSSPEGLPGEVQQPDPAAVIQVVEERLRTMEAEMVNIRRTFVE